jgi:putative Ca2+/H+ antiporter (TMEM165/GDT1 family)
MALQIDWKLFLSTLALIFVAELPDKTAFATLLLATRKHPLPIFIGVAMAFVIQSVVAVSFGSALGLLPRQWVSIGAAFLFISIRASDVAEKGPPGKPPFGKPKI